MIIAAHQPNYIPWPGFFHKVIISDAMVFLDHVQYADKTWTNRNRIKTAQGVQWLSVPVRLPRHDMPTSDVHIDPANGNWRKKHWKTLHMTYGKAPYFHLYANDFEKVYSKKWDLLVDLNIEIIEFILKELECTTKILKSSDLAPEEKSNEMLIDICKKMDAEVFLSGSGGPYMETEKFEQAGIKVLYQKYKPPRYPQLYGNFEASLSVLDLLFNCGPDSLKTMMKDQEDYSHVRA